MVLHADPCTLCMHHFLQSGWPEKGLRKGKGQAQKKPLIGQRLCGVNEPGGMQNRNGPASDVLLPVPVVLPVLFPAVAVR